MKRLAFAVGLLSGLVLPRMALAQSPEAPAGLSEAVKVMLSAQEDGKPVVSKEARAYTEALPSHIQGLFSAQVEQERVAGAQHAAVLLELRLTP